LAHHFVTNSIFSQYGQVTDTTPIKTRW